MSDVGPPAVTSNTDINTAQFPTCRHEGECIFLLGIYLELVDSEVISKEKELLLETLVGVVKTRIMHTRSRVVPQLQFVL